MQKTIILGLDQSLTSTGLAFRCPETNQIFHTCFKTKANTYENFDKVQRANAIRDYIKGVVDNLEKRYDATVKICMEDLAYGTTKGNSSRDLAGLFYVIISSMVENYEFSATSISTIKKFTTGNGNAGKELMAEGVSNYNKTLGDQITEFYTKASANDVVDAVAILIYNEGLCETVEDAPEELYAKIDKKYRHPVFWPEGCQQETPWQNSLVTATSQ